MEEKVGNKHLHFLEESPRITAAPRFMVDAVAVETGRYTIQSFGGPVVSELLLYCDRPGSAGRRNGLNFRKGGRPERPGRLLLAASVGGQQRGSASNMPN